jgi:hypothetical protein
MKGAPVQSELRQPDRRHLGDGFDGPHPEIAAVIASAWAELFDDSLLVVGPRDDFFKLGGSSLLALRLVALLDVRFGVHLDLLTLAESAALGDITREIARLIGLSPESELEEGEIG